MTEDGNGAGKLSVARIRGSADAAIFVVRSNPACREGCDSIRMQCEQCLGCAMYLGQQIGIAGEIGHAHSSKTGLPCAEQLTWTAQFEIALCDFEAIVAVTDSVQSCACQGAKRRSIEQDATTFV